MRAPIESINCQSDHINPAATATAINMRARQLIAPSIDAWRKLSDEKSAEYAEFCRTRTDASRAEVFKLRQRVVDDASKRRQDAQNKTKHEQQSVNTIPITSQLSHMDEQRVVASPKPTAPRPPTDRKRKHAPDSSQWNSTTQHFAGYTCTQQPLPSPVFNHHQQYSWPSSESAINRSNFDADGGHYFSNAAPSVCGQQQDQLPCIQRLATLEEVDSVFAPIIEPNVGNHHYYYHRIVNVDGMQQHQPPTTSAHYYTDDTLPPGASASQMQHMLADRCDTSSYMLHFK